MVGKRFGGAITDLVHSTGGWTDPTTGARGAQPNAQLQMLASKQSLEMGANAIGYLMNQTEVLAYSTKDFTQKPKGFLIGLVETGGTEMLTDDLNIRALWGKLVDADTEGLLGGFSTFRAPDGSPGMSIAIDKGGKGMQDKIQSFLDESVGKIGADMPYNIHHSFSEGEILRATNDWTEAKNGQSYLGRIQEIGGRNAISGLVRDRRELEALVKADIAKGGPGPEGGGLQADFEQGGVGGPGAPQAGQQRAPARARARPGGQTELFAGRGLDRECLCDIDTAA